MTYQPRPGDVGLSGAKAQGVVSLAIRLGAVLRHEPVAGEVARWMFGVLPLGFVVSGIVFGAPWWALPIEALAGLAFAVVAIVLTAALVGFASRNKDWFSHSFIVNEVSPSGQVWITEATGKGVKTRPMHYQPGEYVWLKTSTLLSGDDEDEMRAFLDAVTAARWKYDYGTLFGLAIYCITGAFLVPAGVGTAICSGLTSEALTRGRAIWPLPSYRMMPQDQHTWALAHAVEIVETGV